MKYTKGGFPFKEAPLHAEIKRKTSSTKEDDPNLKEEEFKTYETDQYDKEGNLRAGDDRAIEEFTGPVQIDKTGRESSAIVEGHDLDTDTVYWNKPKEIKVTE